MVGCEQSGISGTGRSAGLSLGSLLLVHVSNSGKLALSARKLSLQYFFLPLASPSCCLHLPRHPLFLNPLLVRRWLHVPRLSCQKAGLGLLCSHSRTGWPAQLLGDNRIVLGCPRAEWGHTFCSLCSFSFS